MMRCLGGGERRGGVEWSGVELSCCTSTYFYCRREAAGSTCGLCGLIGG